MSTDKKTFVPVSKFGKDHWSTFAYIETRIMDYKGEPDKSHMRTDTDRHPQHVGRAQRISLMNSGQLKKYPTVLKNGVELADHDDWDCLADLIEAGLLSEPADRGTGLYPVYELTESGTQIASQLREHKSKKGQFFADFEPAGFRLEKF